MDKFLSENKQMINLPVPFEGYVYMVWVKCGDFCMWQEDIRKALVGTEVERVGCGKQAVCKTIPQEPIKVKMSWAHLREVLEGWGDRYFATEEEAVERTRYIVAANIVEMQRLGFKVNEDGTAFREVE